MPKLEYGKILNSENESSDTLIVLFIPGKDKNDKELKDQEQWAIAAGNLLGQLFGGSTTMPVARGTWFNPETKKLIAEPVILIHCYVRAGEIASREKIEEVGRFLHRMGKETKQGEVAILIGDTFHRIRKYSLA
ncbi:MAG: hypothetical protein ACKV0T_06350 [Planctomycetales bacterium]